MKQTSTAFRSVPDSGMRNKHGPVLVFGYYGAGNLGDDLLMEAVASAIEREGFSVRTGLRSASPPSGDRRLGFRLPFVSPTIVSDAARLVRELRASSALVLGGGGVFQDTHHFSTVAEFVLPLALAALFKKPAVVWAVGIGPYRSAINSRLATLGLSLATTVTVRDPRSATHAGVQTEQVEDPVWWLATGRMTARPSPTGLIGFVLREWEGFNADAAVKLIARCSMRTGKTPVLIPFEYSRANARDFHFSESIRTRLAEQGIVASIPLNAAYPTVGECCEAITSCDVLVTMRFHGAMLALANDVPVCAIGCSPKITDLLAAGGLRRHVVLISEMKSERAETVVGELAANPQEAIASQRAARSKILGSSNSTLRLVSAIQPYSASPPGRRIRAVLALASCTLILAWQCVFVAACKAAQRLKSVAARREEPDA